MTESITMKEFFAMLVRRGRGILITALVCAVLLGGWQMLKAAGGDGSDDTTAGQEQQTGELAGLKHQLEAAKVRMTSMEDYVQNAPLMSIDPYRAYTTTVLIGIDSTESVGVLPTEDGAIISDGMVCAEWLSGRDIQNLAEGSSFAGIKSVYLQDLFTAKPLSSGVLGLNVYGKTQVEAEELADILYRALKDQFSDKGTGLPVIQEIISLSTRCGFDEEIMTRQDEVYKALSDTEEKISTLTEKIQSQELALPHNEGDAAPVMRGIKFAVLGFVVGAVLACVWLLLRYIVSGHIETASQLAAAADAPYFGTIAATKRQTERWADALLGETVWPNQTAAVEHMVERVAACEKAADGITILLSAEEKSETLESLVSGLKEKNYPVSVVTDAKANTEVFSHLKGEGAVLLAERRGRTRAVQLSAERELLQSFSRRADGVFFF